MPTSLHTRKILNLNLENLAARRGRREPRERLLARAADADQQGVAARNAHDAVNARHVLERVLEEHQVHALGRWRAGDDDAAGEWGGKGEDKNPGVRK